MVSTQSGHYGRGPAEKTKMAELSIAGNKFEGYKCCANDVIHFKLVRSEEEILDDVTSFKPEMSHQLFGDSESIFGYKDLRIEIYCTAAKMLTYVGIKYTDKITPEKFDGIQADNVEDILRKELQPGYLTNKDDFLSKLQKDVNFKPYGEMVHSYTVNKDGKDKTFELYKTDIDAPGFRDYHERLQPFLLFYVDAASYIDVDDDKWSFFTLYEKYNSGSEQMHAFAGYMTVYNYYSYPENLRPRISQMIVMPPFQRQGHGARLIQTFYNECYHSSLVRDITVEDPSEDFQRVRDFIDAKNCLKLDAYHPDKLCAGFTEEMATAAREKLKLNRKQARRIYEILRLKATNTADPLDYKGYRVAIKKRLNQPFQKNGRDFEKLRRALNPNELAATMNNVTEEQRLEYLEKTFQETVDEYRHILERVAEATE